MVDVGGESAGLFYTSTLYFPELTEYTSTFAVVQSDGSVETVSAVVDVGRDSAGSFYKSTSAMSVGTTSSLVAGFVFIMLLERAVLVLKVSRALRSQ